MERGISGGLARGLQEWRLCIKVSWEAELGTQSYGLEWLVGETGDRDAMGSCIKFTHPKWQFCWGRLRKQARPA